MSLHKTHCKRGHEFTPENTYVHAKTGGRSCRTCRDEYHIAHPRVYDQERAREYRRRWRENNPLYHKEHWLKRAYNLSLADLNAMLEEQKHKCAICGDELTEPQVDHDHATGKVRQLLCVGCNTGIGAFRENPVLFKNAIAYLETHNNA